MFEKRNVRESNARKRFGIGGHPEELPACRYSTGFSGMDSIEVWRWSVRSIGSQVDGEYSISLRRSSGSKPDRLSPCAPLLRLAVGWTCPTTKALGMTRPRARVTEACPGTTSWPLCCRYFHLLSHRRHRLIVLFTWE